MDIDTQLENQLGQVPIWKFHITSFLPQWVEIELIFTLGATVSEIRAIFKITMFRHGTWTLAKVPKVAHIPSFYPRGSKLILFLLYGQKFPRYGQSFKIAIFGHGTWPYAIVPEVAYIPTFYPKGSTLSLFSLYIRAAISEIRVDFQIAIFGHET